MKKELYRVRQYVFSVFVGLVQNKETELVRGENAILKLPEMLAEAGIKSCFVATTPGFIKRGTLDPFFAALGERGISYTVFTNIEPDPSVSNVEDGVRAYLEAGAQAIVAIGGGSVLDCAKVIGARISNPKTAVRKMRGMLKIRKPLPPYYPVPTTCGTGSEVTAAAVITDEIDGKHYKYAVTDLKLIPKVAVLDPNLLSTLPDRMLLTTCMDALTHAIEAYVNLFASKAVTEESLEAVKLIFDHVEGALRERDAASLDKLLYASTLAGIAITHNFVGYVHAIAHAVGAIYHLPHGYLNAIILPVVLKKYEDSIEEKMKRLCEYAGVEKRGSYTDSVIGKLREINTLGGIPGYIAELDAADFDEITDRANKEANPTYPVPVIFSKDDIREVLSELSKA